MRVFVAYGGEEARRVAALLHEFLNGLGRPTFIEFEAFMAPNDTPLGEWGPNVRSALLKADIFLVVYSPGSDQSDELKKEIVFAKEWGLEFHALLDDRISKTSTTLPNVIRGSGIDHYNANNPSQSFEGMVLRLQQKAVGLPYSGLRILKAMMEQ